MMKEKEDRDMLKFNRKIVLLVIAGILVLASGCHKTTTVQDNGVLGKNSDVLSEENKNMDTNTDSSSGNTDKLLSEGSAQPEETVSKNKASTDETAASENDIYLNKNGTCLKDRILVPKGFTRISYKKNSFGAFLENYPLCESGQPVLLYNGKKKGNQNAHAGVFDMDVADGDLQQCADSVIRMYAEYFYKQKQYDKMKFHFVNGFSCDFDKWRKGMRVSISGNDTSWYQGAEADDSKEVLESYLRTVFNYASTLSMEQESKQIKSNEIEAGDIFIHGGSPGHVVMVVDVCENEKGEKAFLLAQGYMPAQQFHVLKNPLHEGNPWYYETEISYPFETPEYTFEEGSLMRPGY